MTKVKSNIVLMADGKVYEDCSSFVFFYKKGHAVRLEFSYNGGKIGTEVKPETITACYDKDTNLNLLSILQSDFAMPKCTKDLHINQDIFRDKIKRFLLK